MPKLSDLKPLKIKDYERRREFIRRQVPFYTEARRGFYEFLAHIYYNEPTEQEILKAVDMEFKHPYNPRKWIHEDIILVRDYLERYEGKLFNLLENGKIRLNLLGKTLLANLR